MEIYRENNQSEKKAEDKEEPETKIVLEIMRHAKPEVRGKWDKKKRLVKEGRNQSMKKGIESNPDAKVSLAIASPRQRAQETGYRVMLANEGVDPSIKTMEEIENMVSDRQKVGKKMKIDERLDFVNDGPIGKFYDEADDEDRFFQWAVNESDKQAIEYGDEKTLTYERAAGNIAEIVGRYIEIGNNFNRIVSEKGGYEEFSNQLERYVVTHQGVGELFLAKILEMSEGAIKRDEFLKSLGEGFRHTEGFRIEIINSKNGQEIKIYYNIGKDKKVIKVNERMIMQIIDERKILEEIIKNKKDEKH